MRDNLFSPSASSSSSVDDDVDANGQVDDDHADTKAPLFPSHRANSMLAATVRSRSANANSKPDPRRKTMFPASASFTLGSTPSSKELQEPSATYSSSMVNPERRGLFEGDDEAESLESFQERVKLRQSKKKSEVEALRNQLDEERQRSEQLEARVAAEARDKGEFEIRMKECQRIIEKRNKQLMKASERMARVTEQSEAQITELQGKIAALTAETSQLRAESNATVDHAKRDAERHLREQHSEFEAKVKILERQAQMKLDQVTEIADQSVQAKLAENVALRRKIQELESELAATAAASLSPTQIQESETYRVLLKQYDDAEAISRGLRFQLEKEREEKKFLKQQLNALQSSGATVAGYFENATPTNGVSPTGSTASGADLASFDWGTGPPTPVAAPSAPAVPAADVLNDGKNASAPPSPAVTTQRVRSRSQSRSRSSSSGLFSSLPLGLGKTEDASETTDEATVESKRKRRGSSSSSLKVSVEAPPAHDTAEEKPPAVKPASSSINFFEKFSIKFMRSSSPHNASIENSAQVEEVTVPVTLATAAMPLPSNPSVVSPLPPTVLSGRRKVLKERPRMYVAKSPSNHEDESSDSIFGSESDSSSGLDSEDETPPMPPPPPANDAPADRHPVTVAIPPQLVQTDAGADADSSGSDDSDEEASSSDESDVEPSRRSATPVSVPAAVNIPSVVTPPPPPAATQPQAQADAASDSDLSSSDLSDDTSSSDDEKANTGGTTENVKTRMPPPQPMTRSKSERSSIHVSSDSSSDSSSASDDEVERRSSRRRSRGEQDTESKSKRNKRSLSLPRTQDGAALHGSHGDARHRTTKSRMNEYMEQRTKKRNDKLKKKAEKENEEHKKKEEYEKEWEKMAQEERERKRKQQQSRRTGRRRPASMKTVRVSQMRQQMTKQQLQKEKADVPSFVDQRPRGDGTEEHRPRRNSQRQNESKTSESEDEGDVEEEEAKPLQPTTDSPPLPPEPTEADNELYLRQQARLRERHELEMKRKLEAEEADQVRGQIHRKVEMWAFGKELLHMILTLDQISANEALQACQLMVVQSPDNETVRKAYRYVHCYRPVYRMDRCRLTC